ncbi:thiamine pyrophosphate-dependent enzyme [Streptomyces sp. NPDC003442]
MTPRKRRATEVGPDPEFLLRLFTTVARARALEDALSLHIRDHGFAGFWHPGKGQEAAAAGACAALRQDDYLFYQGRGATWPLAKGMGLQPVIGDLLGRVTGSTGGRGAGVPHWADPSLGIMGEGATREASTPWPPAPHCRRSCAEPIRSLSPTSVTAPLTAEPSTKP